MIVFVVGRVLENRRAELKVLERDVTKLEAIQAPFPRISYDDAVKILQTKGSEIQWGGDFGGGDETLLSQQYRPARDGGWLSNVDQGVLHAARIRSGRRWRWAWTFWRRKVTARSSAAASASTTPICCSAASKSINCRSEAFNWYLDLRKFGTVPHGGFGMGIERCVAWMCGLEHIRETIAFPAHAVPVAAVSFQTMNRSQIAIIGAPLDLGAGRRGVDMGPSAMRVANLNKRVASLGYDVEDLGQCAGGTAGESAGGAAPREISAADRRDVPAAGRDGGAGVRGGQGAAGDGRGPFHRHRHGGRHSTAISAKRKGASD